MIDQSRARKPMVLGWLSGVVAVALVVGLSIITDGCAPSRTVVVTEPSGAARVVYVKEAPPKPRVAVRPPKPTANAVWIDGCWSWNGHKYVWASGYWHENPRGSAWVPGHWAKKPRGWVWVPGHWR